MELACPECDHKSTTIREYLWHIKAFHEEETIHCNLGSRCAAKDRVFTNFLTFRGHVYAYHSMVSATVDLVTGPQTNHGETLSSPDDSIGDVADGINDTSGNDEPELTLDDIVALWILKIRENYKIPVSTMEDILSDIQSLMSNIFQHLSRSLGQEDLMPQLQEYLRVFDSMRSGYQQKKAFIKHFGVVEPNEIVLGSRWKTIGAGSRRRKKRVKNAFMYVPILKNIARLCQDKHTLSEIQSSHKSNDGYMRDFCDGAIYDKKTVFESSVRGLQIILYFDELEVCNPLGSRKSVHKLGLFYYSFGNYSNRSLLRKIHLAAIATSQVIKMYTVMSILQHIVDDIKKLEVGHTITLQNGNDITIQGSIAAISADNPASCSMGGFKEGGTAYRGCRQCMATDFSLEFNENNLVLRNKALHLLHCEELDTNDQVQKQTLSREYGINRYSPLLELQYFDMCNGGLIPDVMHDVLEGVLALEMKLMLQHYILNEKYLDVHCLVDTIIDFEYEYMEAPDRPSYQLLSNYIKSDFKKKLGQSATQLWLLGRLMPLFIGPYIPENDSNWDNFLLLLKITDFLLSPVIAAEECSYLQDLIVEYHSCFVSLYPQQPVTPKMHYIVHMPRLIKSYGPLSKLWTMRFEAKHQYFKKVTQRSSNFINLPKTLSERHQFLQIYELVSPLHDYKVGPVLNSSLSENELLELGIERSSTQLIKWIRFGHIEIKCHCAILYQVSDFPQFIKVNKIIVCGDKSYFSGEILETDYYSHHYHCSVVNFTGRVATVSKLHSHHPDPLHIRYFDPLEAYIVVLKHNISFV